MKSIILSLFIAFIALPYNQETNANDEKTVTLSQVSSLLTQFQDNENYDFIMNKVNYRYIEEQKYDEVFEESAIIYATIKQVRETVDGINDGEIQEDSEFAILCIGFAVKDLPDMDERIQTLLDETKNMAPKNDFKGKKIMKAGKAADGLSTSKNQLKESAALLPILLTDLAVVSKRVIDE